MLATRLRMRKTNVLGGPGVAVLRVQGGNRDEMAGGVRGGLLPHRDRPSREACFIHPRAPSQVRRADPQRASAGSFRFVPPPALPAGATSIVDDRESGTRQYLLSNPITKPDFFLRRIAGLLLATTVVIFIGFGGAGMLTFPFGSAQFAAVAILALSASLLNAVMLALALIISEVSKRNTTAIDIAIFFWFLFTAVSGLNTLTYAVYWRESAAAGVSLVLLDRVETSCIVAIEGAHLNESLSPGQAIFWQSTSWAPTFYRSPTSQSFRGWSS